MPSHGADVAVVTADWSIVFLPNASPAAPSQRSSHDVSVERFFDGEVFLVGVYLLTLGSGGTDVGHEEVSVTVDNGATPAQWGCEFVDNTHRIIRTEVGGAPVDPTRNVKVAIRRLAQGGEP